MTPTDWRGICDVVRLGHKNASYFDRCKAQFTALQHRVTVELLRREGWSPQAAENEIAVHGLGNRDPEIRNDIMLGIVAELT